MFFDLQTLVPIKLATSELTAMLVPLLGLLHIKLREPPPFSIISMYAAVPSEEEGMRVRVTMAGVLGAGKTCIVHRVTIGTFPEGSRPTIGSDYMKRRELVGTRWVNYEVWDTSGESERLRAWESRAHCEPHASRYLELFDGLWCRDAGEERFASCTSLAMRGADVILLVYDAGSAADAKDVVGSFAERHANVVPLTATVLVAANKSDCLSTDAARAEAAVRLAAVLEAVKAVFSGSSGAVEGFLVSAKADDGMAELREAMLRHGVDSATEAAGASGYAVAAGGAAPTRPATVTIDGDAPLVRSNSLIKRCFG